MDWKSLRRHSRTHSLKMSNTIMSAFSKRQRSTLARKSRSQRRCFHADRYWVPIIQYQLLAGPWSTFEHRKPKEQLKCLEVKKTKLITTMICSSMHKTIHHQIKMWQTFYKRTVLLQQRALIRKMPLINNKRVQLLRQR